MANTTLTVKLALVTKTTEEWAAVTSVISKGNPVVEQCADGSLKLKIGDGVNTFADLDYIGGDFELTADGIVSALGYTPVDAAKLGVANGVATLDENGMIPAAQMPDGVDEIIEIDTIDDAPETGKDHKIYVALDTGICYRWGGTAYVEISKSITVTESETNGNIKVNGDEVKVYTPDALDTSLNKESENAVTNKAIATAMETKIDKDDTLELNCTV